MARSRQKQYLKLPVGKNTKEKIHLKPPPLKKNVQLSTKKLG